MAIITGITFLFLFLGVLLPIIQADFGVTVISNNEQAIIQDIQEQNFEEQTSAFTSSPSAFKIIKSVFLMFFFTFGQLPLVIDLFFIVLRIILALTIARNIWIGGGG